nr:MAG TPA: hypothetical protein [Caudoviricetes sp.]
MLDTISNLFRFRPVQAFHSRASYKPSASRFSCLGLRKSWRRLLITGAGLTDCDRRNSPPFCRFLSRHNIFQ